jgi:hypothetical protein
MCVIHLTRMIREKDCPAKGDWTEDTVEQIPSQNTGGFRQLCTVAR